MSRDRDSRAAQQEALQAVAGDLGRAKVEPHPSGFQYRIVCNTCTRAGHAWSTYQNPTGQQRQAKVNPNTKAACAQMWSAHVERNHQDP